eukprot:TRINITY_DN75446_c0_g1_i1.p1 TRINITY_DN75446_c0_g1~~TRINITY_DN75446_c0_g1_i1.p1  ORF type:complete len:495 (-),score=30.89 TRINITY_DN75446_c0_g1_i1:398-1882(-)
MSTPTKSPIRPPRTPTKSPYSVNKATPFSSPQSPTSPTSAGSTCSNASADRFIPCRKKLDFDLANYNLTQKENMYPPDDDATTAYCNTLATSLFDTHPRGIFTSSLSHSGRGGGVGVGLSSLSSSSSSPLEQHNRNLRVIYSQNKRRNFKSKSYRVIPQTPERILDAPDLLDDYYLNLLDWSVFNMLVVALNQTVYLWNADTGDILPLHTTSDEDNIITSVAWANDSNTLAVGVNTSEVQLWDTAAIKQLRTLKGHAGRVGSLSWNTSIVASGSRDSSVLIHDTRAASSVVATLTGHSQEVCGLRWSYDGSQLASGGNDNVLNIWDHTRWDRSRLSLRSHCAAVKALGWSPHQNNLLASGGGTQDRTLRFWNTSSGTCLHSIDTKSQVCAVIWSKHSNELVTSHGFSENQLSIWKYPSLKKIADLTGHTSRVLHLAMSPDGQTVVSAAGDETIRFWKCFAYEEKKKTPTRNTTSVSTEGPLSPTSSLQTPLHIR